MKIHGRGGKDGRGNNLVKIAKIVEITISSMRNFLNSEGVLHRNASLIIRKKEQFWKKIGLRAQTTFDTAPFWTPIIFPRSQDTRQPNHILFSANEYVCDTGELLRQGTFLIKKAPHIGSEPRAGRSNALGTEQKSVKRVVLGNTASGAKRRPGAKRRWFMAPQGQ